MPFEPDVEFGGVDFIVPRRGPKRKSLEVGMRNAMQYMRDREKQVEQLNPDAATDRLMERMQSDFRLREFPRHIECFDNSNIQGTNPVASCVVFRNGKPAKRDYRHFNIKTVIGADDFASMKEVLHRRYMRMMAEGQPLPAAGGGGRRQGDSFQQPWKHSTRWVSGEMWLWWELPSVLRKFISPVIRFRYTSTRNLHRSE